VIKPNKVDTVEQADNLLSIVFRGAQDKEHTLLEFTGAGVWPAAAVIQEKHVILCYNSTDGAYRIYTKVKGVLKYVALT